jgi:LysM repeat protein
MKKFLLLFFILLRTFSVAIAENDTIINPRFNVIQNSESLTSAMHKLKGVKNSTDSGFVVAHFGDSHIEGDFLSGVIRKNLQSIFRSGGEGILFPYSICKGYGPKNLTTTVFGEWSCANLVKNPEKYPIGVTGHTLVTKDKNATISFVYDPKNEVRYGNGKIIERVTIWHSGKNFKLILVDNGSADAIIYDMSSTVNGLHCTIVTNYRVGTELKFRFNGDDADTIFNFHGITFENPSQHGLQYNRCGTVGATFLQLVNQQEFTLTQLHKIKPNLIIFSYGSNESYDTYFNIDDYYKRVSLFIARIKNEFPGVTIIFTDTPDTRSRNRFPANTKPINEKLKIIATENGAGFWDLNTIMGGNNSMLYWLDNGLAGKDKLHFTKVGYELQANLFTLAFLKIYSEKSDSTIRYYCDSLQLKINTQLSGLAEKTVAPTQNQTTTSASGYQVHYVQKNETLSTIAKKYGVTVKQICEWNNITEKSVLHVNQKILIRKK